MFSGSVQAQLDFLETCSLGDVRKIQQMLSTGRVQIDFQHKVNGWTALHWASRRGHEEVCLTLLQAGFSREVRDIDGRTPYDVCLKHHKTLREILRPGSLVEEPNVSLESDGVYIKEIDYSHGDKKMPAEESKTTVSGIRTPSRRSSTESGSSSPKFIPNYIRNPPFPYTQKTQSFDNALPDLPGSPKSNGYYSYGRRDSLDKTRFLLLRTSCGNGKEAFKRITLPGGSNVDQLIRTVERAMGGKKCERILTLPDNILIEEDSQIPQLLDCQKIEAIFAESPEPEPERIKKNKQVELPPSGKAEPQKMASADNQSLDQDTSLVSIPSVPPSLVVVPSSEEVKAEQEKEMNGEVQIDSPERAEDPTPTSHTSQDHEGDREDEPEEEAQSATVQEVPVEVLSPSQPEEPESEEEEGSEEEHSQQGEEEHTAEVREEDNTHEEEEEQTTEEKRDEPAAAPIQPTISMSAESENGDNEYVKVDAEGAEDTQKADISIGPKDPSPVEVPLSPEVTVPHSAQVVEEKKVSPEDQDSGFWKSVDNSLLTTVAVSVTVVSALALVVLLARNARK